jgi:hypothetical protein
MAKSTIRKPWPQAWTWAIVLAVALIVAHGTHRWWFTTIVQTLFGSVPESLSEVTPGLAWVMMGWVVLSLVGGGGLALLFGEGSLVRNRYRWDQEEATRKAQWARERQEWQRLQEIRDQLWLDSLPADDRARILERRREEREREQRAQALLEAEQQGAQWGHDGVGGPP